MPERPDLRLENIVSILATLKDRCPGCEADIDLVAQKVQDLSIMVYAASRVGLAAAVVDPETGFHLLDTKGYTTLTGYLSDELEVTPLEKIFCGGSQPVSRQSKFSFAETSIVAKDGRVVPVEAGFGTGKYNGKDVTVVYLADISERKQLEEERAQVEKTRAEMDASMKTVSFIAHDMSNALTVFAALKAMSAEELAGQPEIFDALRTNSSHLVDIIGSLQNFAHGRLDDKVQFLNVKQSAEEAVGLVLLKYLQAGVVLDCEFDDGCTVNVQQNGLKRAMVNLLENALEAVSDSGYEKLVWFSVYRDSSYAYFVVRDNGMGIDKGDIKKIFALYSTKNKGRPSGFGLSSVYSFAVHNHGQASVSSKGSGKGASFTIRLPYAEKPA